MNIQGRATLKYELFFELSSDLLCIAGYDGYFKKINPAVSNLLGYSMDELYARPIDDFIFEDDRETTSRVRNDLTRKKPLINFENRYVTKNGEILWLSWTSHPAESEQLIFAIAKDITHVKRQEIERNALLADFTRVNNELKQLNYTTSHDLRSPVNNLLSVISLIDISRIKDQPTIELMEILKQEGDRLKQTLNNYVDILTQQYILHANLEVVDLNECLENVLQSINSLIQTSNATVNVDFNRLKTVKFNRVYLISVFLNLLTNSIKYASPDRAPVIDIYSEKVDGVSQLTVTDNGLGFDMEKVQNKIFGLHQKFHNHIDSKGIGLYLVYTHITSLGGHISVDSKVNEGARFVITFNE